MQSYGKPTQILEYLMERPKAEVELAVSKEITLRPIGLRQGIIIVEVQAFDPGEPSHSYLGTPEIKGNPFNYKSELESQAEELIKAYKMPVIFHGLKQYEFAICWIVKSMRDIDQEFYWTDSPAFNQNI